MDRNDVFTRVEEAGEPVLSHIELSVSEEELAMLEAAVLALNGLLRANQDVISWALDDAKNTDLEVVVLAYEKLHTPIGVLAELREEQHE